MVSKISNTIIVRLIQNNLIPSEDAEIYEYGLTQLIKYFNFLLICIIIGISTHTLSRTIWFLICFIPLRNTTGGFHLKHEFSCFLFSILTILLYTVIQFELQIFDTQILVLCMTLLACLQLALPLIDHVNKPIDNSQFVVFRSYKIKVIISEITIGLLASIANFGIVQNAILLALGFNFISNFLGIFFRKYF